MGNMMFEKEEGGRRGEKEKIVLSVVHYLVGASRYGERRGKGRALFVGHTRGRLVRSSRQKRH